MTFNKVGFNGVVTSFATGRTRATGLFSRVTLPIVDIDADVPTSFVGDIFPTWRLAVLNSTWPTKRPWG